MVLSYFIPTSLFLAVFRNSNLTLECLPHLRKCHLAFSLREMCVPENRSLPYITTMLGQLACPDLQEITLVVKADNMKDLRALDSECGVREVHPVQFNDLAALDWTSLETSLRLGRLPSLKRVVVEGCDDSLEFFSYMQGLYPALTTLMCMQAAA